MLGWHRDPGLFWNMCIMGLECENRVVCRCQTEALQSYKERVARNIKKLFE